MRIHHTDLRGVSRLTIDAVAGLTDLVEAVHHTIARAPGPLGPPARGPTRGITGLVYRSIRTVTGLVGHGLDRLLAQLMPELGAQSSWPAREAVLAALNGVLGDYLAATGNPLAIRMRLRRDGQPLEPDARSLAASITRPGGKLVVLAHGLCTNDLQWTRRGHDHGAALARDLGYTPVYLHYNSGLHVSTNGRAFSGLLEALVGQWPVPLEALAIVGHSMGGLVARSAHHYGTIAGHVWVRQLRKLVFLGTPHHGAPLERGGNWIDVILDASPYTAPFARLGKIRSAGITDLRYGNLLDEDWEGRDRFARSAHRPRSVPLPDGVQCYTIAATTGKDVGDLSARLVGDGLVPLGSALGRHKDPGRSLAFPASGQWIACGTNHLDLLSRPEVYAQLREWLGL
jgi:hypothetical protein